MCCSEAEDERMKKNISVRDSFKMTFPTYSTRAMRREFVQCFGWLAHDTPAVLREMYWRLTGDSSSSANATEAEVDERVSQLLDSEDPNLIWDLRVNNQGRPEKYEAFLEECKKYIDSHMHVETAVDDRRHDTVGMDGEVVTHLAVAMNAQDLYEAVKKRCSEDTPIPSLQWLRLQFWPRNASLRTASTYTGRLKVKFMIQAHQYRKAHIDAHIDAHYASALFRYEREFAVKYAEYATFVSLDDKHVIKVEEPGLPIAAVERGKKVLVSLQKRFEVGDHDFSKFSLTPSVALVIDIPETVDGSFYRGDVFVGLKENAFEPSNPVRHMTELNSILRSRQDTKPILLLYTDGGPDHRLTYISVKLSLIALFLKRDLDYCHCHCCVSLIKNKNKMPPTTPRSEP